MPDATSVRVLLQSGGYCPIPLNGKVPVLVAWQKHLETDAAEIQLWRAMYPTAVNTGILTRLNPTIDSDLLNEAAAEAVEGLARERFEERGYFCVRIGLWPKRAIVLRTDAPFPKMTLNVVAPSGKPEKIEVLCDGQQLVVNGIHPDTHHPYLWHGGEPGQIKSEDLPYVREDELKEFLVVAGGVLARDFGYRVALERPKAANGAGAHAPEDWCYLIRNILTLTDLHDSSRDLAAKLAKAGMQASTIVNVLRGVFEASDATRDASRQLDFEARYADIPRAAEGAVRKYGTVKTVQDTSQPVPDVPAHVFNALDRIVEGATMATAFTVVGMFPEVGVGILSGHPGVGKTHIVNDLMCSVATGMPFAGHEVARVCGCVLFAAEGAEGAPERWAVLRHAKTGPWFESIGLPADTAFPVDFTAQVPYLNEADAFEQYDGALSEIARLQAERMAAAGIDYDGLGLVVIDTWNASTSLTDDQHNRVGSTQAIFNMLRKLAVKHRCMVLVVDHLGKDQSRGPLGSINKTASPDVDLRITGKIEEDGTVAHTAMTVHKLRAGAQGRRLPFELKTVQVSHTQEGKTVIWDAHADGMRVPKQNKRHALLMKALDAAIDEHCQWVRMGDNANYKAADSKLVRGHFELSHPATAEEGSKRVETIKKAFNRAIRDSSECGLIASKTLADKSVVIWRTDFKFGDRSEVSELS